ncbi:FAD-dependent oxidoreductase [Allokutzneria sp. NRRL B-24872]|uniref:FAD-dependent oxidoreductase n=1 Tax=Allokutzneria sp. NRRL B-24872 TaxID=1137961 RepID=UPI000A360390|nr:FAD-dependent oxidoreductase [Allokutzneria sp. NRRL B-24872]
MSRCCVVGGGPGGLVLAYLMARAGVEVTLLESQPDFDRDFRGDSLHPATLELMDQLGLADRLLELEHFRATTFSLHSPGWTVRTADYDRIGGKFPYVALMPQARFLDFLAREAAVYPNFELRTNAKVTGLVEEDGRVVGVRCGGEVVRADLVVAADGRFSRMRRLADLPVTSLGGGGDILWFRLPRRSDDPPEADVDIYFGAGHYIGLLGGPDSWQVGYTIQKGGFQQARRAGVEPIREFVRENVRWLADRADLLTGFEQITLLSVDIARAKRWHRPGLLMIGDAAHVISPVGGNGILMAVQDAVVAANVLIPALKAGEVGEDVLAEVQRLREPAIEKVQAQQVRVEQRTAKALATGLPYRFPLVFRLLCGLAPFRKAAARANAYGPFRPRLNPAVLDM